MKSDYLKGMCRTCGAASWQQRGMIQDPWNAAGYGNASGIASDHGGTSLTERRRKTGPSSLELRASGSCIRLTWVPRREGQIVLWACDLAAHGARHGCCDALPMEACQQPLSLSASRAVPEIEVGTCSAGAGARLRRSLAEHYYIVVSPVLSSTTSLI